MKTTAKIEKEILEELKTDMLRLVDEFFPKIKPNGRNKGRGEAAVLAGISLANLEDKLLPKFRTAIEKEVAEEITDLIDTLSGEIPDDIGSEHMSDNEIEIYKQGASDYLVTIFSQINQRYGLEEGGEK